MATYSIENLDRRDLLRMSAVLAGSGAVSGRAEGQVINVMGRVLNLARQPVRDATVEVWQANTHGRYTHPSDPNPSPLDPNFEGSAVLTTGGEGGYHFKTIKPAAYPAGPNRMRPAHIHFQVSGKQDKIVSRCISKAIRITTPIPFSIASVAPRGRHCW
jgi:protocatechuate 3,4-dioxygenase beta subunit